MADPNDNLDSGYLERGTQIGFYAVDTRLGAGGFGSVYRVTRDGKPYALKLSTVRLSDVPVDDRRHMEDRVNREVSALNSLRHANIVRVHGFERWPDMDGFQYIVMDYVEGAPLLKWRRAQKPSAVALLFVFKKIALALHEMHRLEVYHRDLKSANVLVRNDGEPVIVDFGLARPRSAYTVTRQDWVLGTMSHFAPEYVQYIDSDAYRLGKERFAWKPTTDLYALGVVLYEALTGRQPHRGGPDGDDEGDLLDNIKKVTPQRPTVVNPALPGAVDELVMKLLEKNPAKRHQSGEELAEDIDLILSRAATRDGAWSAPLLTTGRGGPEAQTVGAPKSAPNAQAGAPPPGAPLVDPNAATRIKNAEAKAAAQAQVPGKLASLASIDVPLSSIAAEPAKPQPPAKPPLKPQSQSQAQPAFSVANRAGEVAPGPKSATGARPRASLPSAEHAGFVSPDEEGPASQLPASRVVGGGPQLSTQVREAAARVEAAGKGKRGSSRWLVPGLFVGFVLIALALVVANQAARRSAAPKAQDLLARVQSADQAPKADLSPSAASTPARSQDPAHVAPLEAVDSAAAGPGQDGRAESKPALKSPTDGTQGGNSGGARHRGAARNDGEDARAINDELAKANYARPTIPGPGSSPGSAPGSRPARPAEPSPFAEVHRLDAKPASRGPRIFGIPLGTHIKVRLVSNLDSRTLSDAPVEAKLMRSFYLGDEMKLPARTMVYGEGSARVDSAGGRFTIRFTRLVLPDRTEVPLTAVAIDGEDRKPGLRAGRTITIDQPKGDGTATKVGKATAGVLLGQLPGDASGQVAQRAGQVVLDGNGNPTSSGQSAALLDSGADFDVFVKEAF